MNNVKLHIVLKIDFVTLNSANFDALLFLAASECSLFCLFNPNEISHSCQLDRSISVIRVGGRYFSPLFKF